MSTATAFDTPPPRRRTGPLLFVPARWQRVAVLTWLKRVHAWTGLWGAALFLLLGTSGFLLNHRGGPLKIDTGAPVERSSVDVAVPAGTIGDAKAIDGWAKAQLGLHVEGRDPPKEPGGNPQMLGRPVIEAERWTRVFTLPDTRVTVSHLPGSRAVTVKREDLGLLGTVKNLHKGTGMGIAWVLLFDTIAGALVTMSLTGVLLWSRLHGGRLLGVALLGGSAAWAMAAAAPNFGSGCSRRATTTGLP